MISFVRRTTLLHLLVALACLSIAGCGNVIESMQQQFKERGAHAIEAASRDTLRASFEQANKLCPKKFDPYTTLVSIEMLDEHRVEYRYEVSDSGKKLAKRADKQALRVAWLKSMQGNPIAAVIADRNITIEHIYQDTRGGLLFAYMVNRAMLQGDASIVGTQQINPLAVTNVKHSGRPAPKSQTDTATRGVKLDTSESTTESSTSPLPSSLETSMPKAVRWTPGTNHSEAVQQNPFALEADNTTTAQR